jgi:hypothetical protein
VPGTHPESTRFGTYYVGWAKPQGKHSNIGYDAAKGLEETSAKLRLGSGDPRLSTAEMQVYTWEGVNTNMTKTLVDAAARLKDELPKGTPADQVLKHWLDAARRDDAARRQLAASRSRARGCERQQIGHAVNNMLRYQARPFGDDPNKCSFEVAVYELYPNHQGPETDWDFAEPEAFPHVLRQDFSNMAAVQRGMKNVGYRGAIPNPKAEGAVVNLHRNLAKYMGVGAPERIE